MMSWRLHSESNHSGLQALRRCGRTRSNASSYGTSTDRAQVKYTSEQRTRSVQLTTDQVEAIQLEAEEGTVYIKLTSRHDVENLLLAISSNFCTVLTNLIGNNICIRENAHCHSQSIEHTSRHTQRQNNRRTDEVMDSK
jgi:UDP-N-acetylmuramyl pentapeptide synthase